MKIQKQKGETMIEKKESKELGWNIKNSYTSLPKMFYSLLKPTPVLSPRQIIINNSLATSLGLNEKALQSNDTIAVFAGNKILEGAQPLAQAYAGHQFGHFTMLGDGRAILIGEQITPEGEMFDIQLKGSGRTPYSRGGDGRAALGPMLREYIISEAMYGLGIPTTRSLAVVTTGEEVMRQTVQTGAILTRVAASHIRVGTFQYASQWGSFDELKALADYTLQRHYLSISEHDNPYLVLLQEVIKRQAMLIAKWQLVGFIHGVMNTDNMTISGETIDYGPCAFMDTYDPATVFSSIDMHGRYAYGNQPTIAAWNLTRLAESLLPLIHKDEEQAVKLAQDAIEDFAEQYHYHWLEGMRAKLGMFNKEDDDESLIVDLLSMMETYKSDYTNTFRALALGNPEDTVLFGNEEFNEWNERWKARLSRQREIESESKQLMKRNNPAVIPRNFRVEEALEAAEKQEDFSVMERLLEVLSEPYAYSDKQDEYSMPPELTSCKYRTFCGT